MQCDLVYPGMKVPSFRFNTLATAIKMESVFARNVGTNLTEYLVFAPGNLNVYTFVKTTKVTEWNTKPRNISFKHKLYFDIKPTITCFGF